MARRRLRFSVQSRWMTTWDSHRGRMRRSSPFVRIELRVQERRILTVVWMSWTRLLVNPSTPHI